MVYKSRRRRSANARWSQEERDRLWDQRRQNLGISWVKFQNRFFPHRSMTALAKAYSDMKWIKQSQGDQDVGHSRRISQDNKRKHAGEAAIGQRAKRQQTSHITSESTESEDESDSQESEGTDEEDESEHEADSSSDGSESETDDSDAGDIPHDKGVPRRPLNAPRLPPSVASHTVLKFPTLANRKIKPIAVNTGNTMRPIKMQIPPVRSPMTLPLARNQSSGDSTTTTSPTESFRSTSSTGQLSSTTQTSGKPATDAVLESSVDSYSMLSQTFQRAAKIFVEYPQVKARAEKAERENVLKERHIRELQSSHFVEVAKLQGQLAAQNKTIHDQRMTIEGFKIPLRMNESQKEEIRQQSVQIKSLELELAETKKLLQSLQQRRDSLDKRDNDGQLQCDEFLSLSQENQNLTEEMANVRDLLDRMIPARMPRGSGSPTATAMTATAATSPVEAKVGGRDAVSVP